MGLRAPAVLGQAKPFAGVTINGANLTPDDWDADDFVGGAQSALQDTDGKTYGFAWEAGAMIMGVGRADLFDKAGVGVPTTFDELVAVCETVHKQDGVNAFVTDKLHHWNWIPYLMGHGGSISLWAKRSSSVLSSTPSSPARSGARWGSQTRMRASNARSRWMTNRPT